jgi:hypothetical protein
MKSLLIPGRRNFLAAATAFLTLLSTVGHAQSTSGFSISITDPPDHSVFTAPANIEIDASVYDFLGRVAYVSFAADLDGLGTYETLGVISNGVFATPPGMTYSFDWTNAPLGKSCSIIATAVRDDGTQVTSTPIEVFGQVNYPFSVSITSPTNGAAFPKSTNIDLIANVAVTNDSVTNVEFFDNWQPLGNGVVIDASPAGHIYSFVWTNAPIGYHVISATGMDTNGFAIAADPVLIAIGTVETPTPVVTITSPSNGSTFLAPTNVQFGAAVDNPGFNHVATVSFTATPAGPGIHPPYVILLGTAPIAALELDPIPPGPPVGVFRFIWSNAIVGTWSIQATAIRSNGVPAGSDSVVITVKPSSSLFVDIASPTNGSTYAGPTNIQLIAGVIATNDSAAYVEFFDGFVPIGIVSNWAVVDPPGSPGLPPASHAYFFDWTNQSAGSHVLIARVFDTNGDGFSSIPVTILVGPDTNLPTTVIITQPKNGADFFGPTNVQFSVTVLNPAEDVATVSFSATPASGLLPLTIFLGSVSNFTSLDPPTRFYMFDWSNALLGTWSVRATALRSDGSIAGSDKVVINVRQNFSLSVDIASPTNGSTFPGPADIQLIAGVAATNDSTEFVEFFDGLKPLGVVSNGVVVDPPGSPGLPPGSAAYIFDWTKQTLGWHSITAVATDTNGDNFSTAPVSIFIGSPSDFPPTVRITSPPNMSVFRAPVNVTMLAYAQDLFEPVKSVEFFADSNSLGFGQQLSFNPGGPIILPGQSNSPTPILLSNVFSLTWTNAPAGSHALTAVALDDSGDSATSTPVNITVLQSPPPPSNAPDVVRIVATDPIAIAGTNCWTWLGGPLSWSNWESPSAILTWFTNCGPNDATFTVFRRGSTNSNITVNYSISGTATNGADYATLPGSVTIPAGQTEAAITIVPIYAPSNYTSTVILTLDAATNVSAYQLGFPRSAETIIIDNIIPRPAATAAGGAVLPDRSFHLSLSGPDGAWFHIDYSTDLVNWTSICTNQVINGSIDFVDPDAATSPERVYRTVPLAGPPSD